MAKNMNTTNNSAVSSPDVGSRLRAEQESITKQTERNIERHEATLNRLDKSLPAEKGGRG